jgi:carboxymethylenebutenolidase
MSTLLLALALSSTVSVEGVRSAALFRPAGSGPFPAVLLVEGWWTPGPWEQATAERLAADGYLVLLVDPARGERPADRDAMHAVMTGPPGERVLAGLRAACAWLLAREDVRARRIAVVGARMGGRDALHLAGEPGVAAAVSWYGVPPSKPGAAPALAFFGGQDMGPSIDDARRFEAAARGTATQVRVYPDAQHGFADPKNSWGGYDEKAARDSWARATAFLEAWLVR